MTFIQICRPVHFTILLNVIYLHHLLYIEQVEWFSALLLLQE
jgi:hypothetical protein